MIDGVVVGSLVLASRAIGSPFPRAITELEGDMRLIASLCPYVFVGLWGGAGWLGMRRGLREWQASALGACVGLGGTAGVVAAVLRW